MRHCAGHKNTETHDSATKTPHRKEHPHIILLYTSPTPWRWCPSFCSQRWRGRSAGCRRRESVQKESSAAGRSGLCSPGSGRRSVSTAPAPPEENMEIKCSLKCRRPQTLTFWPLHNETCAPNIIKYSWVMNVAILHWLDWWGTCKLRSQWN